MNYTIAIHAVDRKKRFNQTGKTYNDIEFVGDPIPEQDLINAYIDWLNSDKKTELRQLIIDMSEAEKAKYVTNTPGKAMAYAEKKIETEAYTNGERDPEKLPIMAITADMNGTTIDAVYNLWLPNVLAWPQIGGRIEAKYDLQMTKLKNVVFSTDGDVQTFISEIDLSGVEPDLEA